MPVYKIKVKWDKEKFEDVECDTDNSPMVFKALMYSLSGVPPERQKIMMKGGTLGDDGWGKIKLTNGATIMMMGSADPLLQEPSPAERPKFVEDMDEGEIARAMDMPPGLSNLGNTCYMNATLQCLHSIPELRDALRQMNRTPSITSMGPAAIVTCMQSLFASMDNSSTVIYPFVFLQMMHSVFPQFATKAEGGKWMQQDANECYTELVRCLQQHLPLPPSQNGEPQSSAASVGRWVDTYMRGEQTCVLRNTEDEGEEPTKSTESFLQLSCFIDSETKYLHTGLRSGLEGSLTKHSPSLGRDAVYKKSSTLSRLPAYLSIQLVRFYFKEKAGINAKVLRDVKFQLILDVFEFCDEALKRRLLPMREKFKIEEDRKLTEEREKKLKNNQGEKIRVDLGQEKEEKKEVEYEPYHFPDDIGSNNSGYYELQAVLTHQGRASNTGHYVSWVRKKDDVWTKFDDDKVTECSSEEVLRLSGGGDWHMAYVLLYGPRRLEKVDETDTKDDARMDTT